MRIEEEEWIGMPELVHTKPMDEYHHSCNRFNKIVEEPVKHSILDDFFV